MKRGSGSEIWKCGSGSYDRLVRIGKSRLGSENREVGSGSEVCEVRIGKWRSGS